MNITPETKDLNLHGLAKRLVASGLLQHEAALSITQEANKQHVNFITMLIRKDIFSSKEIANAIAVDFGLPLFDLNTIDPQVLPKEIMNSDLIEKNQVLPIFIRGKNLYIALSDPTNLAALDAFKFHTGLNTQAIIVEDDKLQHTVKQVLDVTDTNLVDIDDEDLEKLDASSTEVEVEIGTKDANDNLVIKYVNKIILDAIHKKASDIHFESYMNAYRIRFRIDGILYEIAHPPAHLATRVAARLKVMSRLDISERRVPQDGHFKIMLSKQHQVEFRISTCPTVAGEKIVLRLLDPETTNLTIEQLGFDALQKELFMNAIHRPQGMVLVTGPTGSGKTVSLYTGLNILNTNERNISAVEDPVELYVKGINQVAVNLKAGFTFASALRAFLRQDPDVIMIGEIRDLETAEIAIKAAQTGHLVLSTLHTNSAAETLTRLVNMGIPTYNIATSVNLIVAQRLVRVLCKYCKKSINYPTAALLGMGYQEQDLISADFYEPVGCSQCTNGYVGRIGIYETLEMTATIGRVIMSGGNSMDIVEEARKQNMQTLRESGLKKAREGIISLSEVSRVTQI